MQGQQGGAAKIPRWLAAAGWGKSRRLPTHSCIYPPSAHRVYPSGVACTPKLSPSSLGESPMHAAVLLRSRTAAPISKYLPLYVGSCEGGTLPVIMSIIGPRVTHDYREINLCVPGCILTNPKRVLV